MLQQEWQRPNRYRLIMSFCHVSSFYSSSKHQMGHLRAYAVLEEWLWVFSLLKGSPLLALSHHLSSDDEINHEGFSCHRQEAVRRSEPRTGQLLSDGEVNKQAGGRRARQRCRSRNVKCLNVTTYSVCFCFFSPETEIFDFTSAD